jgi:hypothetical protein
LGFYFPLKQPLRKLAVDKQQFGFENLGNGIQLKCRIFLTILRSSHLL